MKPNQFQEAIAGYSNTLLLRYFQKLKKYTHLLRANSKCRLHTSVKVLFWAREITFRFSHKQHSKELCYHFFLFFLNIFVVVVVVKRNKNLCEQEITESEKLDKPLIAGKEFGQKDWIGTE